MRRFPLLSAVLCLVVASCQSGRAEAAPPAPSFSIDNASANEALGQLCFQVRKHGKLNSSPSQVRFYTIAGTAKNVEDFAPQDVQLKFAPTETAKTACVPLVNDGLAEPTETLTGKLQAVTNARLYDGTAVGTIIDATPTAPPPAPPVFTCPDITVSESAGVAHVVCSKTGNNGQGSQVRLTIGGGMPTATQNADYRAVICDFILAATDQGFSCDIPIIQDSEVEAPETFGTVLTITSNGTVGHNAQVLIQDDDQAPVPPASNKWTVRELSPLATLEYVRTVAAGCRAVGPVLHPNGDETLAPSVPTYLQVAGGTVFKTIPGDWGWPFVRTPGSEAGYMQRGWQVDDQGAILADAPFMELDRSCVEGVTPGK